MAESAEPDVVSREPFSRLASVRHEYDALERLAEDVRTDVREVKMEVDQLGLENKWCFDEDGNRTRPAPSEETARIITESADYPDILQDIIGNLKQKKSDLQMTVADQETKVKNSSLLNNS